MIHFSKGLKLDQKKLNAFCRKYHIKLLVLHGSYATQTANADSDVDVGLLFNGKAPQNCILEMLSEASEIFGEKCDTVFLNHAESLICYEVATKGIPLFEESKDAFDSYQASTISRYQDTKKFRFLEQKYLHQRIKEME